MRDSICHIFSVSQYFSTSETSDGMDRPRYLISYEQLRFLVGNHFSVPQIANMLHVSVRAIFRRMSTFFLCQFDHNIQKHMINNWILLRVSFRENFLIVVIGKCMVISSHMDYEFNSLE